MGYADGDKGGWGGIRGEEANLQSSKSAVQGAHMMDGGQLQENIASQHLDNL